MDEVSDSLYVDSADDTVDSELEDHKDQPAGEEEQAEAAESSEPGAEVTIEAAESSEPGAEVTVEAEATAVDEETDVDATPPFESDVSSALFGTETEAADSALESQAVPDASDEDESADEAAAEFAAKTVYSEPSAPEPIESVSVEPDVVLSEPSELSDTAEADKPSDLYVEDYSRPDEADAADSADSTEATGEASSSPTDQQVDHLQPTGEPSTIFSQTAGIPHIPAPGMTSTPEPSPPGGTEVAPPSDLDGPGWAFTASAPSGASPEDAQREEAKRLARLLITEIKLYNEEEVEEGRQSLDLTRRLGEEIERSRQIYDNRIEESIRSEADYFQEELVNILAGGDAEAL